MRSTKNLGQTLTNIVKNLPCFVSENEGIYQIVNWSGSNNFLQFTAQYIDGTQRAIGANATKDRLATPEEERRYLKSRAEPGRSIVRELGLDSPASLALANLQANNQQVTYGPPADY